jgi:hypothetical protein
MLDYVPPRTSQNTSESLILGVEYHLKDSANQPRRPEDDQTWHIFTSFPSTTLSYKRHKEYSIPYRAEIRKWGCFIGLGRMPCSHISKPSGHGQSHLTEKPEWNKETYRQSFARETNTITKLQRGIPPLSRKFSMHLVFVSTRDALYTE